MPSIRVGETFSCLHFGQNDVDLSIYPSTGESLAVERLSMVRVRRVKMKIRGSLRRVLRWKYIARIGYIRIMKKLDKSKVMWIIQQKRDGNRTNADIATALRISAVWVKKL